MTTLPRQGMGAWVDRLRHGPGDASDWLVFADWLADHGDPRGELVRLSHTLFQATSRNEVWRLKQRIAALQAEHEASWTEGLVVPVGTTFIWRCGFVVEVGLRWHDTPLGFLDALVAHPSGAFLKTLTLCRNSLGDDDVVALATSGALRGLRRLDLNSNAIGAAGIRALVATASIASLTDLDLGDNAIGVAGAEAITVSPHLGSLTRLNLRGNRIGPEGAMAISVSTRLSALVDLDLSDNGIGRHEAATAPQLGALSRVDLRNNDLGPEGAGAIAQSAAGQGWHTLILQGNGIADLGAMALATSPHLTGLQRLDLRDNGISADGVRALLTSEHLSSLMFLDLSFNEVGTPGGVELFGVEIGPPLQEVDLRGSGINPYGARRLRNSAWARDCRLLL